MNTSVPVIEHKPQEDIIKGNMVSLQSLGFTPLSSSEIKKDFHDIEHHAANNDDASSDCSVKTEDALQSSYPVKPRKTIKPAKPTNQSQVMSLSQYYQQQRQHQSEPLQLQQQALQPSQVSMSDISIGPNQAKSKTTFISYDKRVINETLLMYQLIQREHPDLWKEEIAYEAMSQKVQSYQLYLASQRAKFATQKKEQENYIKIFQGLLARAINVNIAYNKRIEVLVKLIIRFQQLAETGNMQRESLDQLKQLQLQFSSLAAAEEAAQSSSTQPQVGSKRKSTAASKLSNQQIQQHQPQIEIPVELTKQASSVVRLINNSHERVATLYKGLFISTPFSPGRVVELYPVDQRLVVQLSFGKLYSTFSKALSWGKLSSAATTTSDTDLTKVEPSSNHLSLESVPTHILDELDMESIVKSVESIIAASHINTPHTTQLEVDRLLAQAIKDAKTQITTNTTETNTTPMEVTDSSQKIEANHSIPIVEDSTNIPQAVLQNDPSTSSSSNINNRPTYVLKNRHIPASDVLLATTPLSLVTELIRRLPSELRLMPSAFRPHIDSKTVTDGLSPSGVISSSSSEHLGRNPIHLYPNQVPSQVLQPKMASSSVDPQISRDRILLQERLAASTEKLRRLQEQQDIYFRQIIVGTDIFGRSSEKKMATRLDLLKQRVIFRSRNQDYGKSPREDDEEADDKEADDYSNSDEEMLRFDEPLYHPSNENVASASATSKVSSNRKVTTSNSNQNSSSSTKRATIDENEGVTEPVPKRLRSSSIDQTLVAVIEPKRLRSTSIDNGNNSSSSSSSSSHSNGSTGKDGRLKSVTTTAMTTVTLASTTPFVNSRQSSEKTTTSGSSSSGPDEKEANNVTAVANSEQNDITKSKVAQPAPVLSKGASKPIAGVNVITKPETIAVKRKR